MKNKVNFISKEQLAKLKTEAKDAFVATIDGAKIYSWSEYWNSVATAFSFPDLPAYMKPDYHSYYDLMTDLSWIDNKSIVMIIENANEFLKNESSLKSTVIKNFNEYLLPFWEKEVSHTVVNGHTKDFCVYFVE